MKRIIFGVCLMMGYLVQAQYQFFKVENGTKTLLKSGEPVNIQIDDNLKPNCNILLELNVAEFRKQFTYDKFQIELIKKTATKNLSLLAIALIYGDDFYTTKYGQDKILRYYLFHDNEIIKDAKNMYFFKENAFKYTRSLDTLAFRLIGCNKTGTERYYENNTVKIRDVWSSNEYFDIPVTPIITFSTSEKLKEDYRLAILEKKYQAMIIDQSDKKYEGEYTLYGICSELKIEINKVKSYLISSYYMYPQIVEAMEQIVPYKADPIKAEPDKEKALTMLATWASEFQKLFFIEKITPEERKALNKKLKPITDVAEKYNILMNVI